jgi:predicted DNA-binding transcriptional regulator AlpA
MSQEIDYGNLNKKIVFTDNDHRQVQLKMRLKTLGLTQSQFFRLMITGVLSDDDRIYDFISDHSKLSKKRKLKSRKLRESGKQTVTDFGLGENEIDNIFDLIAEEFPEL